MAYKVITQSQAETDVISAFEFIAERGAPEAAARWYRNVKAQIESLADMPARGAVAPESEKLGFEIRQIHFGKRSGVYRILYRVLKQASEVHVLAVRHGARREVNLDDID